MASFSTLEKICASQCRNAREPWKSDFGMEDGRMTTKENTNVLPAMITEWRCPTKSYFGSPVRIPARTFISCPEILDPLHFPPLCHFPEAPLWPKEVLEPVVVTEGSSLVLPCNPPPGLPPPFTFWMSSSEQHDTRQYTSSTNSANCTPKHTHTRLTHSI